MNFLSSCRFVLVRPSHPGNIGAVARAMKTMGIARLYLVSPKRFPDDEAFARATHAADIVESAVVCSSLETALSGTIAAFGLSARTRDLSVASIDIRKAANEAILLPRQATSEIAFVFGNETTGLTNDELALCDRFAMIPTTVECASLNLGSAAQVVAYELRMSSIGNLSEIDVKPPLDPPADFDEIEGFYGHLETALGQTQFLESGNAERIMRRLRRLFGRSRLEQKEVMILRGILSAFERAIRLGGRAGTDTGKSTGLDSASTDDGST